MTAASGAGQTVTLQDGLNGYAGTRDAFIYENALTANYGSDPSLVDQQAAGTKRHRSLVKFAIVSDEGGPLPVGATVTSATLSLYKHSYYNHTYRLRPLLSAWVESEVTWSQRLAGVPWVGPGATAVGSDLSLSYDAEAAAPWDPGWVTFDVTSGVQAIASGRPNHGWALEAVSGNSNFKEFRSSEYTADLSLRPRLIISYTVGAPNAPPSVALSAPANGASFALGAPIALAATASDTDGTVSRVEFFSGASLLGADASAPFEYTWTEAPAGTHTLTAVAVDDDGARTTSSAVTVTVSAPNLPPTVALSAPPNGADFALGAPLALAATASDTDGTVSRVEFFSGASLLGADTSAPFEYTWTEAPAGTHTLTAVAVDDDGARTTSSAVTVTVSAPNLPPTVQAVLTGTKGDNDWYTSNVTLSWQVSSPVTSTEGCQAVTVRSDTSGITYSCNATNAGGTTTQSVTITRDASAPTISITTPAKNGRYDRGGGRQCQLCLRRYGIRSCCQSGLRWDGCEWRSNRHRDHRHKDICRHRKERGRHDGDRIREVHGQVIAPDFGTRQNVGAAAGDKSLNFASERDAHRQRAGSDTGSIIHA